MKSLVGALMMVAGSALASEMSTTPTKGTYIPHTVRELVGVCREPANTPARTYCYGFLSGAHDLARVTEKSGELAIECPPLAQTTPMESLRLRVLAAAEVNPEMMRESAAVFVVASMSCKPRK